MGKINWRHLLSMYFFTIFIFTLLYYHIGLKTGGNAFQQSDSIMFDRQYKNFLKYANVDSDSEYNYLVLFNHFKTQENFQYEVHDIFNNVELKDHKENTLKVLNIREIYQDKIVNSEDLVEWQKFYYQKYDNISSHFIIDKIYTLSINEELINQLIPHYYAFDISLYDFHNYDKAISNMVDDINFSPNDYFVTNIMIITDRWSTGFEVDEKDPTSFQMSHEYQDGLQFFDIWINNIQYTSLDYLNFYFLPNAKFAIDDTPEYLERALNDKNLGTLLDYVYFSIVTITTLGFGDIVPNSTIVRLMVSVESIIGLILMGMFITIVLEQRKKQHN